MSSLNQLISEIAHSVQQADSVPVRRAIRQGIIHARNELIRHSFSNHNYTDKVLKQNYTVKLKNVSNTNVKQSENKIPKPVRFTNNLPFHTVKIDGVSESNIICHISEGVNKFYKHLPGMENVQSYDYIDGYLYVYGVNENVNSATIESVFEYPHEVSTEYQDDNNEFFLPEDLVNSVKKLVLETFNAQVIRDTNEIPNSNLLK